MTQRTAVRFFLVGLPVGLAISVVVGLWFYYNPVNIPKFRGNTQHMAPDARRKSPTALDLSAYRRVLTTDLASRAAAEPAALERTANWIAGSLGPTNVGLTVQSTDFTVGGVPVRALHVEVPGRRAPGQVIVVTTGYDTASPAWDADSAVASLMTLAGAFVGTPQKRSVVFAFTAVDQPPAGEKSGPDVLVEALRASGRTIDGVLDLRVLRTEPPAAAAPPAAPALESATATADDPWRLTVQEMLAPRKPAGFSTSFASAGSALPASAALPWLRTPPPAPSAVLALRPPRPGDEAALLAWVQSLESLVQALANR